MARQFADRVEIVGVGSRDAAEPIAAFVAEHDLVHVPTASDVEGVVWQRFGITGQPAWIFIDGETGEATRNFGALTEADLTARLEALTS